MADYVRTQQRGVPDDMQTRYRDMSDGTHALVISAVIYSGDVTAVISGAADDSGLIAAKAGNNI